MFNVNTVIGINSAMSRPSENKKKDRIDYRKELQEIIKMVDAAKFRLGDVSCQMDADDLDTAAVDEAMDALDDAMDTEKEVIQAYDVWKEKKNYGKVSMGVVRTTYLIDENGIIVKGFDKVKAADNPAQMLGEL